MNTLFLSSEFSECSLCSLKIDSYYFKIGFESNASSSPEHEYEHIRLIICSPFIGARI